MCSTACVAECVSFASVLTARYFVQVYEYASVSGICLFESALAAWPSGWVKACEKRSSNPRKAKGESYLQPRHVLMAYAVVRGNVPSK